MVAANTLGKRLRWLRDQRGETLKHVGAAAGITDAALCQFERGRRTNPTIRTLIGLSRALSVDPMSLLLLAANDLQPTQNVLEGEAYQRPAPPTSERDPAKESAPGRSEILCRSNPVRHLQSPPELSSPT